MLKIEHLKKNFGSKEVLRGLQMEVKDQSVYGLVGINGAGKSTLLRTIAGIYEPEDGTVTMDGVDTWKEPTVRKKIAFVSDDFYFPMAATIQSMKCMYESMYDFDAQAFEKYRQMFELDTTKPIAGFSKGMKRKTALLFALSIHPRLLLLDEAYDGLEPLARLHFKKALTALLEDEHISVIISSHNLKELEDVCDTFGILEEGKIISYGDLLETKEQVHMYQVAFETTHTEEDFREFDLLHFEQQGQVYQLVIRGKEETVKEKLQAMKPLLLNVLPVNFEELFIYELESRGQQHAE